MSLIKQLADEISAMAVSEPIFKIRKHSGGWQGTRLTFTPMSQVGYQLHEDAFQTNPLQALARRFHQEHFNGGTKRFMINYDGVMESCRLEVKNFILGFTRTHCSGNIELCRWYENYALSSHNLEKIYFEPLLGIYKYMCMNQRVGEIEKHQTNAAAILDLIFQRDFREQHLPQRKRRRRRRK